ncbi:Rho termination factor N-terminal domain-containing protein [Murimonas intestini]|uniref:Rho termination factor N-terminal domain-containing protein n=1 Tax=Murimonas intestini TaxID=1337051 RepID=UPI00248CD48B|nr:Rho termination factor N-terminal domain-containing protein [Murimonas intestini]
MRLIMNNVERTVEDDAQMRKLMAVGFKLLESSESVNEEQKPELEKMKVDELKALAKEKGMEGAASLTKEELLMVLKDVV